MPFDQVQCADLSGWTGAGEHANWRKVTSSIGELVEGKHGSQPAPVADRFAPQSPAAEPLLAVLAFDNLSGDPEMAYFSDGVSEEIQQSVARGADLKVVGRTSSFQFRGPEKAAGRIGVALNATHVLDGAVRRSGQRVRISAQLVECARDTTLWSDRFDGQLDDVFTLQDEIAAAVAAALRVVFAPRAASS
jgi:adenylate cyclase